MVGDRDRAIDRDAVIVEEDDQAIELEVASERDRFLADAFHQASIAGNHVGIVVNKTLEARREIALGNRHADRICNALAERTGCGLHAGK